MNNVPIFSVNDTGGTYYGIRADNIHNSLSDVITVLHLNTQQFPAWNDFSSMLFMNVIMLFLRIISGNNLIGLMNEIVSQNNDQIFNQLAPLNKYNNTIHKLVEYNHELNIQNRWKSLQFVVSDFDKDELKAFGFQCSKRSIRTAKELLASNDNKILIEKPNCKPPNVLTLEQVEQITQHYYDNSRPSPSEVLKIETKKREIIVQKRYMTCTIAEAYETFAFKDKISKSSFRKYKGNELASPKRITDKCYYCMEYHIINNRLHKLYRRKIERDRDDNVHDVGYDSEDDEKQIMLEDDLIVDGDSIAVDVNSVDKTLIELTPLQIAQISHYVNDDINQFSPEDKKIWNKNIADYRVLIKHRNSVKHINDKYNDMIDNIGDKDMVIVGDTKQNIIVCHCPEESHYVFRHLTQRQCLNFTIFTKHELYRFNYISDYLTHSAIFAKQCLRHLFDQTIMQNYIQNNAVDDINFWFDNGRQFRANKFCYYPLIELPYESRGKIKNVSVNYFTEYHGKSDCDVHFGHISYWINLYSHQWSNGIKNTNDVCKAITTGHAEAVIHRKQTSKRLKNRTEYVYNINFDMNVIDTKYKYPLLNRYGLEYRTNIPQSTSIHSFKTTWDIIQQLLYMQYLEDDKIHNVNNSNPGKPIYSIDENFLLLLKRGEKKWAKWVAKHKEIQTHSFNIQIKPFPYSDDDQNKIIAIHPGFERSVRKKMAPNKPIPEFKSTELNRKIARRSEIFN